MDVFRVGRPLMPLDTLSSYSFDASTFERFATADAPVIVGLEHGSANGVGVLAVVDASRASAAGAVVQRPVRRFSAYNGPRGDLEAAFLRVDGLAAFAASRRECYSFALTRQRELAPREVLAQLHSRSTAARLAASVEAAESAAESTAGDVRSAATTARRRACGRGRAAARPDLGLGS
ncbi:hypothetical protein JL720_814 [Aureococcus anophagefferens]|nr:hypothetical protein JL720_814 [Aureococcus anophagefferens]